MWARCRGIVAERGEWIRGHVERLRGRRAGAMRPPKRPASLPLRCLGRKVALGVAHTPGKPPVLRSSGPDALLLAGDTSDDDVCRELVLRWLKNTARQHLVPMLRALSEKFSLPFERAPNPRPGRTLGQLLRTRHHQPQLQNPLPAPTPGPPRPHPRAGPHPPPRPLPQLLGHPRNPRPRHPHLRTPPSTRAGSTCQGGWGRGRSRVQGGGKGRASGGLRE